MVVVSAGPHLVAPPSSSAKSSHRLPVCSHFKPKGPRVALRGQDRAM